MSNSNWNWALKPDSLPPGSERQLPGTKDGEGWRGPEGARREHARREAGLLFHTVWDADKNRKYEWFKLGAGLQEARHFRKSESTSSLLDFGLSKGEARLKSSPGVHRAGECGWTSTSAEERCCVSWGQEGFQNRLARDHAPWTFRFPLQILRICLGPNPTFCFQTMLYSNMLLRSTLPPGWPRNLTGMIPNAFPEPQSQDLGHQYPGFSDYKHPSCPQRWPAPPPGSQQWSSRGQGKEGAIVTPESQSGAYLSPVLQVCIWMGHSYRW